MEQACWDSVFGTMGGCFNDRFCVGRVILLPFDKRLNVGRRDQANIMAKFADLTRPVMRGGEGLHRNRAFWAGP